MNLIRIKRRLAKKAWRGVKREASRKVTVYRKLFYKATDLHEKEYYLEMIRLYSGEIKTAIFYQRRGILPIGSVALPPRAGVKQIGVLRRFISKLFGWIKYMSNKIGVFIGTIHPRKR